MTKIASLIHGIYPRSGVLAQTTRDFERARVKKTDVAKKQKTDFTHLVSLQKTLSFAYIEDGKNSWQDIFRPLVLASSGMEVGALTRWFDNNSFFRQPIFNKKVTVSAKKLNSFFYTINPLGKWKVTLPSPYTFAKLGNSNDNISFEERLAIATNIIVSVVQYLEKKGVAFIQLNEPYMPYHTAKKSDIVLLQKSLREIKKEANKTILAIHFYFGDAAEIAPYFFDTTIVDVVGIDFYKTAISNLPNNISVPIIAGILDGRNSLLENKFALKKFIELAVKRLNPPILYLSNNSDMEFLPETVASKKLHILGDLLKA